MPKQSSNKTADTARRKLLLGGSAALAVLSLAPAAALSAGSSPRQEIILKLQQETGLEAGFIEKAISQATYDASVIKRIKTPYESRAYREYRPLFVHQRLADKGLAYLKEHRHIFERAEKRYGVQPEIIAAVLGMETRYGHYKGKDRVLDALYTLATGYPRRANFFRNELGEFLQLCHEEGLSPTSVRGSYAGAFGTTQFIPSSYRGYAVDADNDGRRDVWESPDDIINSVANYFHKHRWDQQRPVAHWMDRLPKRVFFTKMLQDETKKWRRLGELRKHAVLKLPDSWSDDDRVALIQRETSQGRRTALVHYNFYVITRWNRSY
ncbi:MAG: lytic murein transglycosylase, partial [Mariprofundaceae bacterium]|nr:lytic murein transglycosylase [Mariprofundaceae bacterium]